MTRSPEHSISLSGIWEFRQDERDSWQPISVPGCWENLGLPHDWEGPGWYRLMVELPAEWRNGKGKRLWLRFGAVSYACTIWINDIQIGDHMGAWDAFMFDVTEAIRDSINAKILVRVIKPGGPTYPTNRTTAGFLPYVWGYLFGGIWQDVTLMAVNESESAPLLESAARVPSPLTSRELYVEGHTLLLNGRPFYPRMALSWGWYPETLHCNPPPETMRAELESLRALGYNGVKCCLWIPPPAYLDLCDESGMLVWLELPLWLPEMDAAQREQVLREYEAIVRQVRHHPCVIIWTLGCELSASCPDAFLKQLYERVKTLAGSPLVRDNSGGGECYGGLLQEHADYYDYHFYCDLPFLRGTFDYFLPHWRPEQPWLFGEFCDADAFRDLVAIKAAHGGEQPWWALDDSGRNPQGARWDMNIVGQWPRLEQHGLLSRREELKEGQRRQTLLHRKFTVELVRSYREMSGYVITGLRDTPISIAGMIDDQGQLRYMPEEFTRFNADTVLFMGWHRRRNWVAGGDRPSYIDYWCHWSGDKLLPRIGISHYGDEDVVAEARWSLRHAEDTEIAAGRVEDATGMQLPPGTVRQMGMMEIAAPAVTRMTRFRLSVTASMRSGRRVENEWPLWSVPRPDWDALPLWSAYDPDGSLAGLERHGAKWRSLRLNEIENAADECMLVASRWTSELANFARDGGRALVFVDRSGGLPFVECPFWREAMKLFNPHPLWARFPHEQFTDLHFYGLGPDCALDPGALPESLPDVEFHPLLRRVDARSFAAADYVTEAVFPEGGRLLLTTLRPHGGLGDQPDGLLRHVAGIQFLVSALQTLARASGFE